MASLLLKRTQILISGQKTLCLRFGSSFNVKDKTIGVIGMGQVGKLIHIGFFKYQYQVFITKSFVRQCRDEKSPGQRLQS